MKSLTTRFGIIGAAAFLGLLVLFSQSIGLSDERPLKLGIDLSGGTILVYQVDPEAGDRVDLDELIAALKRRINPEGVYDITIRKVGSDRVEIIMPRDMAEQAEEVKRKLTEEGSLEFRILASTETAARFPARLKQLDEETPAIVEQLPEIEDFRWARLGEIVEGQAPEGKPSKLTDRTIVDSTADWPLNRFRGLEVVLQREEEDTPVRVRISRNDKNTLVLEKPHGLDPKSISAYRVDFSSGPDRLTDPVRDWTPNRYAGLPIVLEGRNANGETAQVSTQIASNTEDSIVFEDAVNLRSITSYRFAYNPSGIPYDLEQNQAAEGLIVRGVRVPTRPGTTEVYVLYEVPRDSQNVTGDQLDRVYLTQDRQMQPAVGFDLGNQGSRRFGNLTGTYRPREQGAFKYKLAIILDGELMSAPAINDRISDRGIIEMGGGQNVTEEVNFLIDILRAGSLPVALVTPPLQEETIGPTLGEDTIRKGVYAIGVALALVPVFMILYYRFAGLVSVIALLLNMVLLLSTMAVTDSSITLPGLAGLALTIGMAVDANVLIFERMREERDRGASLAQQIRNGFGRAWSTILDSNVTTILAGLVLWSVGTEEVKGFALVMIIGLVWNLFTAVFVSHSIFDLAYSQGWIKRLSMMRLMSKPNIDFVSPRRYCMLGSALVIAVGLVMFVSRGGLAQSGAMYNIDFTGGTLVTVRLDDSTLQGQSRSARVASIRERASELLPNVTVESLAVEDEAEAIPRYNIRTTEQSSEEVQNAVLTTFDESLVRVNMEVAEAQPIPEDDPAAVFPGGTRYTLRFNLEQNPSRIAETFAQVLASADPPVASPQSRFRVVNPNADPSDPDVPGETLVLSTNLDKADADEALVRLNEVLRNDKGFLFERLENFGATVAGETRQKAIVAVVASWLIIIAYLWFRFQSVTYGVAAVVALVHDVLIALGAVAVTGYKIDLPMIAAFLTLIGFSVNDTIVIFDRIREIKGKAPNLTPQIINQAINATLSRTVITTVTSWIVVLVFYLFGGEGLAGFSFCLVVGFLSGTYSTIFIAAPILVEWIGKPSKRAGKEALATSR